MAKRRGVTWEDVWAMAAQLPAVEAGTSYGTPALRVKKKFMARLRPDDPDVMVLTGVEEIEQRLLMEMDPETFFLTDHYRGYTTILIRLSCVDRAQLQEMLETSWRRVAPPAVLKAAAQDGESRRPKEKTRARR